MDAKRDGHRQNRRLNRLRFFDDKGEASIRSDVFAHIAVYVMWFLNLGLAIWLLLNIRLLLLIFPAILLDATDYFYPQRVEASDKLITLSLGVVWLVFMVFTEEYFRRGIPQGDLIHRFAKVTGAVLISMFVVGLLVLGVQGFQRDWFHWLILSTEITVGIGLVLVGRKRVVRNRS